MIIIKSIKFILFAGFNLCFFNNSIGQQRIAGPIVICPADTEYHHYVIKPPAGFNQSSARSYSKQSSFEVDYVGFSEEAKEAFQHAVVIWESLLKSDVPIKVRAAWEPLGTGVLGAAGAATFYRNFTNAPESDIWYPVALAEKLAGKELNGSAEYDIVASFNSGFKSWYFGTDGEGGNKYDLVSVVLHELAHGLGFVSGSSYSAGNGTWDLTGTGFPVIYTKFIQDSFGTNILEFSNGSEELGTFLTSNNLYIGSELTVKQNSAPARIYAPQSYNQGSSISHWDEATFYANENSLMTPHIAPGEVLHHPGPLTLKLFADMGWFTTRIEHEHLLIADKDNQVKIDLKVHSDIDYSAESLVVKYVYDGSSDTLAAPFLADDEDIFQASITPVANKEKFFYSIQGLINDFEQKFSYPSDGTMLPVVLRKLEVRPTPYLLADGGDFESRVNDFTPLTSKASYELWQHGLPAQKFDGHESNAWMTKLEEHIQKPSSQVENILVTPLFDMRDSGYDYVLSFEWMNETSGFDFLDISYSLDTGRTWLKLGVANDALGVNWYSRSEYGHFFQNDSKNEEGHFSLSRSSYPLFELVGNTCMFKFTHHILPEGTEEAYEVDGFLLDNFEVTAKTPVARFCALDTGLLFPGSSVRFLYASSGADSFLWDFGDGTTSSEANPVHLYEEGGTYSVSLSIHFEDGEDYVLKEDYVKIIENRGSEYLADAGGSFEHTPNDFVAVTISGTPFERGKSEVDGKNGTSSGEFAWVTGLNETSYANRSEAYLYGPEFDFSVLGPYTLSFKAKYSFEDLWDGFIVEYTTDRGGSWIKLNDEISKDWYDAISDPNSIFGSSVPIFTGTTDGVFEQKVADVSFLGGEPHVSFRFKFLSDPAVVDVGLALDDFELQGPSVGEMNLVFGSELTSGVRGCEGVVYTFINESTGSIKKVEWIFGSEASPPVAEGVGPHEVTFPVAGNYNITLNAVDFDDQISSVDTTIIVSPYRDPVIEVIDNGGYVVLSVDEADSYQWFLNENVIDGATAKTYTATRTGNYSVETIVGECAVTTSTKYIVTGTTSGEQPWKIYPNPTAGTFNVDFQNELANDLPLRILDISGKVIYEQQLSKGFRRAPIHLPPSIKPGVYFVEFTINESHSGFRVILK